MAMLAIDVRKINRFYLFAIAIGVICFIAKTLHACPSQSGKRSASRNAAGSFAGSLINAEVGKYYYMRYTTSYYYSGAVIIYILYYLQ